LLTTSFFIWYLWSVMYYPRTARILFSSSSLRFFSFLNLTRRFFIQEVVIFIWRRTTLVPNGYDFLVPFSFPSQLDLYTNTRLLTFDTLRLAFPLLPFIRTSLAHINGFLLKVSASFYKKYCAWCPKPRIYTERLVVSRLLFWFTHKECGWPSFCCHICSALFAQDISKHLQFFHRSLQKLIHRMPLEMCIIGTFIQRADCGIFV